MELAARVTLSALLAGCSGGASVAAHDMTPACSDRADGGVCLGNVSGRLVDELGAPVSALVLSVCAVECWFGKSEPDGRFTVAVDSHVRPDDYALLLHGRPGYASYYTPLATLVGDGVNFAEPLVLPHLPSSGPVIAGDGSAQTLTSGDVTLTLDAGTTVTVDVEDVELMQLGHELRALTVSAPAALPFVDAAAPPDALFAFAPFEALFAPPARLSFANTAKLPAGAAVDVQSMGGLDNDAPPAGRWSSVATAHVSSDGARIEMDAGQGVRELTWIALRKK